MSHGRVEFGDDAVDDVGFAAAHHRLVADVVKNAGAAAVVRRRRGGARAARFVPDGCCARTAGAGAAGIVPERRAGGPVGVVTAMLLLLLLSVDGRGHGARYQNQSDDERTSWSGTKTKKKTTRCFNLRIARERSYWFGKRRGEVAKRIIAKLRTLKKKKKFLKNARLLLFIRVVAGPVSYTQTTTTTTTTSVCVRVCVCVFFNLIYIRIFFFFFVPDKYVGRHPPISSISSSRQ